MSPTPLSRRSRSGTIRVTTGPMSTVYTVLLLIAALALCGGIVAVVFELGTYYDAVLPFGPDADDSTKQLDSAMREAKEHAAEIEQISESGEAPLAIDQREDEPDSEVDEAPLADDDEEPAAE